VLGHARIRVQICEWRAIVEPPATEQQAPGAKLVEAGRQQLRRRRAPSAAGLTARR